ncbi:MAG: extracellular solute-binding protein [Spirochaetales bacterium]|nr:extracellular solute-binding protein [Spirochaetales bacterium]
MKKIVLICLIAFTSISIFAKNNGENSKNKDVIVLNLWDIMVSDSDERVIKPAIEKWNASHPDIQVIRDSLDDASYKTKIKTAIAADEAPDLFFTWGGGFSEPFVNAGKVLNLDDYISDNLISRAKGGSLSYVTYNNSLYGLPYGMWVGVLYCNTELFEKYGVEIPETFSDLVNVSKVFRTEGIGALGVGAAEKWVGMFYHNILTQRTAGSDTVNAAWQVKQHLIPLILLRLQQNLRNL